MPRAVKLLVRSAMDGSHSTGCDTSLSSVWHAVSTSCERRLPTWTPHRASYLASAVAGAQQAVEPSHYLCVHTASPARWWTAVCKVNTFTSNIPSGVRDNPPALQHVRGVGGQCSTQQCFQGWRGQRYGCQRWGRGGEHAAVKGGCELQGWSGGAGGDVVRVLHVCSGLGGRPLGRGVGAGLCAGLCAGLLEDGAEVDAGPGGGGEVFVLGCIRTVF